MVDLTAEQRQLAKIVHDNGDAQLLQGCYDYMDAFKRGMDSASKAQIGYFALQNGWKGWLRALLMVSLRYRKITKSNGPEISAVPA